MTSCIQIDDYVRFRTGQAPEAMKGRERDLGGGVSLDRHGDPELWPVVQFDGYRSATLQPEMVEMVGYAWLIRDDPEMAN